MTPDERPALRRLAEACGVESDWTDGSGAPRRTTDTAREALLLAFGIDASTEARAERALADVPPESPESEGSDVPAPRAFSPAEAGAPRAWGVWTNLYSLRDPRNHGFGDLSDLARLAERAAAAGAEFVGLNPLHALRNGPSTCSPYAPVSRLFRNLPYLDVEAIPELAECEAAATSLASAPLRSRLDALRAADAIDYAAVRRVKLELLRPLHRTFRLRHGAGTTARGREYRAYRDARGPALDDYATFVVLDAARRAADGPGAWWRTWPAEWRDRGSEEVAGFRAAHEEEVDFERWIQFELDRQLGAASDRARAAGMKIGLYQDLAVGSPADSADAWADASSLAFGVSLGAPPDGFAREGQVWSLPPWNPLRLRERGVEPWRRLLREAMRHGGALRIDHVIGLERPFLVPDGAPALDGAPVRFPAAALFGALAEESRRARTVVVGEDLGTVPPGLEERMRRHGILSCRVFVFERTDGGGFADPASWPEEALLTTTTHDHVPLPGWWSGAELELDRALGRIEDDGVLADAKAGRRADVDRLVDVLRADGDVDPDAADLDARAVVAGVHRRLLRSPSAWVALSLDDLAGEERPVNVPGVTLERHPSWSRRMRAPVARIRIPRVER
ncbi:MAG: 4-alpha-glucanotransferase [Planctomycetota bacterium JB042]